MPTADSLYVTYVACYSTPDDENKNVYLNCRKLFCTDRLLCYKHSGQSSGFLGCCKVRINWDVLKTEVFI